MARQAPKAVRRSKGPKLRDEGGLLGAAPDADALFLQLRRLKSDDNTLYLDPEAEAIRKGLRGQKVEKMKNGGAVLSGRGGKFKGIF